MSNPNLGPGDPKLVESIVQQLKSGGKFDQFRKECLADVDTKPAYHNLQSRVDTQVKEYLSDTVWKSELNKNQLRESVRKHVQESGMLDTGIDSIISQVVNPKVQSLILPCVQESVLSYLKSQPATLINKEAEGLTEALENYSELAPDYNHAPEPPMYHIPAPPHPQNNPYPHHMQQSHIPPQHFPPSQFAPHHPYPPHQPYPPMHPGDHHFPPLPYGEVMHQPPPLSQPPPPPEHPPPPPSDLPYIPPEPPVPSDGLSSPEDPRLSHRAKYSSDSEESDHRPSRSTKYDDSPKYRSKYDESHHIHSSHENDRHRKKHDEDSHHKRKSHSKRRSKKEERHSREHRFYEKESRYGSEDENEFEQKRRHIRRPRESGGSNVHVHHHRHRPPSPPEEPERSMPLPPIRTDNISSEEDELLGGKARSASLESIPSLPSPRPRTPDAGCSSSLSPFQPEETVESRVKKMTLDEGPLFDTRSLDSISSNSSGLSLVAGSSSRGAVRKEQGHTSPNPGKLLVSGTSPISADSSSSRPPSSIEEGEVKEDDLLSERRRKDPHHSSRSGESEQVVFEEPVQDDIAIASSSLPMTKDVRATTPLDENVPMDCDEVVDSLKVETSDTGIPETKVTGKHENLELKESSEVEDLKTPLETENTVAHLKTEDPVVPLKPEDPVVPLKPEDTVPGSDNSENDDKKVEKEIDDHAQYKDEKPKKKDDEYDEGGNGPNESAREVTKSTDENKSSGVQSDSKSEAEKEKKSGENVDNMSTAASLPTTGNNSTPRPLKQPNVIIASKDSIKKFNRFSLGIKRKNDTPKSSSGIQKEMKSNHIPTAFENALLGKEYSKITPGRVISPTVMKANVKSVPSTPLTSKTDSSANNFKRRDDQDLKKKDLESSKITSKMDNDSKLKEGKNNKFSKDLKSDRKEDRDSKINKDSRNGKDYRDKSSKDSKISRDYKDDRTSKEHKDDKNRKDSKDDEYKKYKDDRNRRDYKDDRSRKYKEDRYRKDYKDDRSKKYKDDRNRKDYKDDRNRKDYKDDRNRSDYRDNKNKKDDRYSKDDKNRKDYDGNRSKKEEEKTIDKKVVKNLTEDRNYKDDKNYRNSKERESSSHDSSKYDKLSVTVGKDDVDNKIKDKTSPKEKTPQANKKEKEVYGDRKYKEKEVLVSKTNSEKKDIKSKPIASDEINVIVRKSPKSGKKRKINCLSESDEDSETIISGKPSIHTIPKPNDDSQKKLPLKKRKISTEVDSLDSGSQSSDSDNMNTITSNVTSLVSGRAKRLIKRKSVSPFGDVCDTSSDDDDFTLNDKNSDHDSSRLGTTRAPTVKKTINKSHKFNSRVKEPCTRKIKSREMLSDTDSSSSDSESTGRSKVIETPKKIVTKKKSLSAKKSPKKRRMEIPFERSENNITVTKDGVIVINEFGKRILLTYDENNDVTVAPNLFSDTDSNEEFEGFGNDTFSSQLSEVNKQGCPKVVLSDLYDFTGFLSPVISNYDKLQLIITKENELNLTENVVPVKLSTESCVSKVTNDVNTIANPVIIDTPCTKIDYEVLNSGPSFDDSPDECEVLSPHAKSDDIMEEASFTTSLDSECQIEKTERMKKTKRALDNALLTPDDNEDHSEVSSSSSKELSPYVPLSPISDGSTEEPKR